jgi:uncharacterized protein YlxP (DUF503 family)
MNIPQESSMRVALLKLEVYFPSCHSLKEKRHLLLKLKNRIQKHFQVSAHEVSHHDKWQRSQLGLALVGNDATLLSSIIDKILQDVTECGLGELIDSVSEIVDF